MTYQMAKKLLKIRADMQDHEIKEKINRIGRVKYMIIDSITNKIVAGKGYTFSLQDCCRFYGIEIPDET